MQLRFQLEPTSMYFHSGKGYLDRKKFWVQHLYHAEAEVIVAITLYVAWLVASMLQSRLPDMVPSAVA